MEVVPIFPSAHHLWDRQVSNEAHHPRANRASASAKQVFPGEVRMRTHALEAGFRPLSRLQTPLHRGPFSKTSEADGASRRSSKVLEMKTYLLVSGGFLAIALGQTMLGPNQANFPQVPQIVGQVGFSCMTGSGGQSTFCQVDQGLILNLAIPCPAGGLPCPSPFSPGVAPPPGACPSTGSVIATNEPAVYFCVQTFPGAPNLNWIRVAGVNTW